MKIFERKMRNINTIKVFLSFHKKCRFIQAWWRDTRKALQKRFAAILKAVTQSELRYHKQVFIDRHGGALSPPSGANLKALLIPASDRKTFVVIEMRARRYLAVTALQQYKDDWKDFEKQVQSWREQRHAAKIMGGEVGPMPFPPTLPQCYPKPKELPDLVERYMGIFMHRALKRLGPMQPADIPALFQSFVKMLAERKPAWLIEESDA
ncbi:unnamed protein product, partial [Amoebophrya sp. A25]|eukprot:GSA25T00015943001.1